jgi:GNAT superfamily N-acetyltransferase
METLRLADDDVAWLATELGRVVEAHDLERTYDFDHEMNRRRELAEARRDPAKREFVWKLWFFDGAGTSVLESPLARKVLGAAPLFSGVPRVGSIAYNALIFVRPEFRRRGFATAVYLQEHDLYLRWGIHEIQMRAQRDGPVVWRKFGFVPADPEVLAAEYPGWARQRKLTTEVPPTFAEYPDDFLISRQEIVMYKVLS